MGLEQDIDAMFERRDDQYFEMMNGVVEQMHRNARMREIQAELGALAMQRRDIDYKWQSLVTERIELTYPSPS